MQKEAFKAISPYNEPPEEILTRLQRNVPKSSFIEGFPFASNSFVDQHGYPFVRNSKGGLVVLDIWKRGNDRTNPKGLQSRKDIQQGKTFTLFKKRLPKTLFEIPNSEGAMFGKLNPLANPKN